MKRRLARVISIVLVLIIAGTCASVLVGCNKGTEARDENTIQISYSLAGYGEEWIYEAVERFNAVYADQGIKAVVDRSDASFVSENVFAEIKHPEDNPYDLYFCITENIVPQLIDSSYSVFKDRDKVLLENLNDVYSSAPIKLDGTEEAGTVESTRNQNNLAFSKYLDATSKFNNNYYSLQWTSSICGIGYNKVALAQYGYDIPRTTNELKNMYDYVLSNPKYATNGNRIYPVTWPGKNAAGYLAYSLYTWIAQYMGSEDYKNFYTLTPKTGTTLANGYDVYDNEGILYALSIMDYIYDQKYATDGTVTTIDHLTSEQMLAEGEALFAYTGDWYYNELVGIGYDDSELTNIGMMPLPILSEIADLIGLEGTADQKDAKLSAIVKAIDEGKTDAQIIGQESVTAAQVAKVREARGMYYDLGLTHQAIIPSYSNAKDAAKLFLRFISSADFSNQLYSKYAHGVTANNNTNATQTEFLKSLSSISSKPYSQPIGEYNCLSQIRMKGGITFAFEPYTSYVDLAKGMAVNASGYDAATVYSTVKNAMRNNWAVILTSSGMYD